MHETLEAEADGQAFPYSSAVMPNRITVDSVRSRPVHGGS